MNAIITFKPDSGSDGTRIAPHKIINVIAILRTTYSTKFVQSSNRVQSMENCDIENVFLESMGK